MRKVLVLQHVANEILGTLHPLLKAHKMRIKHVNFDRDPQATPTIEGYNGLIVLGGPMGVYDSQKFPHLKHELKLIEQALKKNIPIMGICLGAQLLAHVLGAHVRKHKHHEMGWCEVHLTESGRKNKLFEHFKKTEQVFQMHGDTFDIPKGAEHLAYSEVCEGQAFLFGEKVYGLQFHLEADEKMVHRWLKAALERKEIEKSGDGLSWESIESMTKRHMDNSVKLSQTTFTQFIDLFNLGDRPVVLGSGHGKPGRPE